MKEAEEKNNVSIEEQREDYSHFSETMYTRKSVVEISEVLRKKKTHQVRVLYSVNYPSKVK